MYKNLVVSYFRPVAILLLLGGLCLSCSKESGPVADGKSATTAGDDQIASQGAYEITAKLLEIPGELPDDPLYNYAFVFKYEIVNVIRGELDSKIVYIGHYKPLEPRDTVADVSSGEVGGNLKEFRAGDIHHMALEVPIDDYFMGGIVNRYFEENTGPIYWAVWTNRAAD